MHNIIIRKNKKTHNLYNTTQHMSYASISMKQIEYLKLRSVHRTVYNTCRTPTTSTNTSLWSSAFIESKMAQHKNSFQKN